jgi:hypothetical protein
VREEIVGQDNPFEGKEVSRALRGFESFPVKVPHPLVPDLCR